MDEKYIILLHFICISTWVALEINYIIQSSQFALLNSQG